MVPLFLTLEVHVFSLRAKRDSEIPTELLMANLGCVVRHRNLFVISKCVKERKNCACYVTNTSFLIRGQKLSKQRLLGRWIKNLSVNV
jgi:hypothetical protein